MKNKRTDPLSPIPGKVINIRENAVTARFDDGKVFMRDKSHFKIVRERSYVEERERVREEETFRDNILNLILNIHTHTQYSSIRPRALACARTLGAPQKFAFFSIKNTRFQ
ncbi:Hypothetical predicted protein [Paramuricea clavata]|uniref:Uncharacterized protein n=1 Tax=Paramuricea clavata TaxID=317549 RepID=A0A7D9EJM4_PARCT|nr:Hypothetical predicted protein [Paramuricea clavata]